MIRTVIRLYSGEVMVFNTEGEQISHHQGRYEEVREGILREASPDTGFFHWFDCTNEPEAVSKASW